ncbi:hypothetical protein EDB85DRAFT_2145172 [Lactarius pseudohatsudake]|nr:hypothetical protein EDB85DRAFT_2154505 [Lactarius pseudohatsudake]KAH9033119.1 hypothetical protein EDB85DRAFT_2145172 [Lactarius pseudohatsudake]
MATAGALPTQPRNNHCDDSEPGRHTSTAADALILISLLKLTNIMPASTTTTAAGSPSTRPQAACTAIHGDDGGHAPHAAASRYTANYDHYASDADSHDVDEAMTTTCRPTTTTAVAMTATTSRRQPP